jgi:hypothetical protein
MTPKATNLCARPWLTPNQLFYQCDNSQDVVISACKNINQYIFLMINEYE